MKARESLHELIDQLTDVEAELALGYLHELIAQRPASIQEAPPQEAHYLTVPLPQPQTSGGVMHVRIGPFRSEEEGQQVADAMAGDITAHYLATGDAWEHCVHSVLATKYRHVVWEE